MKRILVLSMSLLLLSSFGSAASPQRVISGRVSFDLDELTWEHRGGFDVPRLADCDIIRQAGAPQLPVRVVQVAIPPNTVVDRVEVVETVSHLMSEERLIYPAQPPQILSLTQDKSQSISFVEPEVAIYAGGRPYPDQIVEYTGTGWMGGVHLADLVVYPLQYLPEKGQVRFHQQIQFALHLTHRREASNLNRKGIPRVANPLCWAARHLVLNERDLSRLYSGDPSGMGESLSEDVAEYVIVTDLTFEAAFQVLADWKTKKGVPARVVTTYWIDSQYEGADLQERIRRFIQDAYQNWGTVWVLLAGDTQLIPHRMAYAMDSETDYNDLPCDLYYADLDGDWNADGDEVFGEVEDEVDLYPEVFIGRAPISTVAQAENFVRKVLTYENPALLDYQEKALFAAEILWSDPYTDASMSKELIDELYLPAQFDPVTKLYESLGNEDLYSVISAMNAGVNIFNHDGHAWYSGMGVGSGFLTTTDMDYLHNGDRLGLLYSIGCWPAAFDHDCVAEHFVNNPDGGGVAFIGNSRYGWGSPGNPCYGYSDRFDQQFFKTVFQDGIIRVGQALATSKAFYAPRSRQENVYRWHQYQLTLLGDPEMPLWTETPRTLTVVHPQQILPDSGLVTVSVSEGDQPVEGALVCLMGDAGVYQRTSTDLLGNVCLTVCPDPEEILSLTVTAANFLPYEDQIMVVSSGAHLAIHQTNFQELSGNGDGVINPGERIGMSVSLKNWGGETAGGVVGMLSWLDEHVAMEDSTFGFGDIAADQVVSSNVPCCFTVGENCPNGHPLRFGLEIQDENSHSWSCQIGVLVATPVLAPQSIWLDDGDVGDGDGVPEAGEELDLTITVVNAGGEQARGLVVELETEDPYLTMFQSRVELGDVDADSTAQATFRLQVAWNCPEPRFPILNLSGTTNDGYSFQRDLLLSVGQVGFTDDLESSSHFWSYWATSPSWHFTDRRTHSGSHSWYCGLEGATPLYEAGMDCALTTLPIVVGPNTELSFWHWYDLATYGSDGLYVEISTGEGWEILDFLGSGGALDSSLIGNDWLKDSYDLSHIESGTFLQVRFRFYSDDDTVVAEGVYVDDVSLVSDVLSNRSQDPGSTSPSHPVYFGLSQNHPNPFNAVTHFSLIIPIGNRETLGSFSMPASVEIFNIAGQRVKTLLGRELEPGDHHLMWNGTDELGGEVSSGIYFCHAQAGPYRQTRKMVLLR